MVRASNRFAAFVGNYDNPERHAEEIKSLEHEADEVSHEAMEMLHQSLITPRERPDIRRLIESLDDVLDLLDDASGRFVLYEITEVIPEIRELARVLVEAERTTP